MAPVTVPTLTGTTGMIGSGTNDQTGIVEPNSVIHDGQSCHSQSSGTVDADAVLDRVAEKFGEEVLA